MTLSLAEHLLYSTTRIEVINAMDRSSVLGTGTGFFFQFDKDKDSFVPVLVTNRHVVENFSLFRILLTSSNGDKLPNDGSFIEFVIERDYAINDWFYHPNPGVDLAVLPLGSRFGALKRDQNLSPFVVYLTSNNIPTREEWAKLDAIEDILMVGYPNGLWDKVNNRPLVRKGITASHPATPFNGKPEFLIDAACYPGSSGSPVFLYNPAGFLEKNTNNINMTPRFYLLGALRAGPQHTVGGDVVVTSIPLSESAIPSNILRVPNNLGFVLRSECIMELRDSFFQKVGL